MRGIERNQRFRKCLHAPGVDALAIAIHRIRFREWVADLRSQAPQIPTSIPRVLARTADLGQRNNARASNAIHQQMQANLPNNVCRQHGRSPNVQQIFSSVRTNRWLICRSSASQTAHRHDIEAGALSPSSGHDNGREERECDPKRVTNDGCLNDTKQDNNTNNIA